MGPHLSPCLSFKPTSSAAFLSAFHSCSTCEGFFQITKKKKKKSCLHHVKVLFNGNHHCCTIQEPARFIRNDHLGLLLKYRISVGSVGRPSTTPGPGRGAKYCPSVTWLHKSPSRCVRSFLVCPPCLPHRQSPQEPQLLPWASSMILSRRKTTLKFHFIQMLPKVYVI